MLSYLLNQLIRKYKNNNPHIYFQGEGGRKN